MGSLVQMVRGAIVVLAASVLVVAVVGCAAGQRFDEGKKLEASGDSWGAGQKYIAALKEDANHKDSKEALVAVVKAAYEQKLAEATGLEAKSRFAEALGEYKELKDFVDAAKRMAGARVETVDFDEKMAGLKNAEAEKRYQEGAAALAARSWDDAIGKFNKAIEFGGDGYKDARAKIAEARYGWGEEQFGKKQFRAAADQFARAAKADASLKDAGSRAASIYLSLGRYFLGADRCRQAVKDFRSAAAIIGEAKLAKDIATAEECSVTPVAILAFDNPTGVNPSGMALSDTIADAVSGKVRGKATEFVRLVERTALDEILKEQGLTEKGVATAGAGKLRGVRFLVMGKLTQVKIDDAPEKTSTKKMVRTESYDCSATKKTTGRNICDRDVPISYTLHEAKRAIRITGSVKVIDTKTGEQLATIPVEGIAEDAMAYADDFTRTDNREAYDLSANPTPIGGDYTPATLAAAPKTLKDEGELISAAVEAVSTKAAEGVLKAVDVEKPATDPTTLTLTDAGKI